VSTTIKAVVQQNNAYVDRAEEIKRWIDVDAMCDAWIGWGLGTSSVAIYA
jgi:hypothetical protein